MFRGSSVEKDSQLATLDLLASDLIRRALPVRFRLANSFSDLEQVFRLRYHVAVEKRWIKPEDFPDGIERDAYDERAVHILALDDGKVVGTSRLVFPQPGSCLPTEEVFGLISKSCEGVADVGRVCVAPGYRGENYRIFSALLCRTWIEMRNRECSRPLAAIAPSGARLYKSWGLKLEILGTPCNHWGEERYPVLISPAESPVIFAASNLWGKEMERR